MTSQTYFISTIPWTWVPLVMAVSRVVDQKEFVICDCARDVVKNSLSKISILLPFMFVWRTMGIRCEICCLSYIFYENNENRSCDIVLLLVRVPKRVCQVSFKDNHENDHQNVLLVISFPQSPNCLAGMWLPWQPSTAWYSLLEMPMRMSVIATML